MELKVGDKVKVTEMGTNYTGKIGIIYEVRWPDRTFKYAAYFGGNRWDWQPFRSCQIEKVSTYAPGEQLLFEFMNKEQ